MGFQGLKTRGIHSKMDMAIPELETRIMNDKSVSNHLIVISGRPRTGKSNVMCVILSRLSKKMDDKEPFISLDLGDLFQLTRNKKSYEQLIGLDDVQSNWEGWWDRFYRTVRSIFEIFGVRRHILIVTMPDDAKLYAINKLIHYKIRTSRKYNSSLKRHQYSAMFQLPVMQGDKEVWEDFHLITDVPKAPDWIWDIYKKKEVLKDDKLTKLVDNINITHKCDWRLSKGGWLCRRCGNKTKNNPYQM